MSEAARQSFLWDAEPVVDESIVDDELDDDELDDDELDDQQKEPTTPATPSAVARAPAAIEPIESDDDDDEEEDDVLAEPKDNAAVSCLSTCAHRHVLADQEPCRSCDVTSLSNYRAEINESGDL